MNLNQIHQDICRMCGQCCFIEPLITIEGNKFIPTSHVHKELLEIDRILLGYMVCEHFDLETRKCKIYEKRPEQCKKFYCNGKPSPQKVIIGDKENV